MALHTLGLNKNKSFIINYQKPGKTQFTVAPAELIVTAVRLYCIELYVGAGKIIFTMVMVVRLFYVLRAVD
jgi:hypothetical protein